MALSQQNVIRLKEIQIHTYTVEGAAQTNLSAVLNSESVLCK